MPQSGTQAQTFSTRSAARILAVSPERIRYWVKQRLVRPAWTHGRGYQFAFNDLLMMRLAKELLPTRRHLQPIRRCLERLGKLLTPERPITALKVFEEDGRILVRDGRVKFEAESGQLMLNFDLDRLKREVRESAAAGPLVTLEAAAEAAEEEPLRAIRLYSQLLGREPQNSTAHIDLAALLEAQGDSRGALRHLLAAAALESGNADLHYRLGMLYLGQERAQDALTRFLRAVEIEPEFLDAHRRLAELYESMGRAREAIRHLSIVHRLTRHS
jgi:tetratricopeptide (TPR) repeat protein